MSHLHIKSYKAHESVRERNKREQRKFDLAVDGRYNEFKFKLTGIDNEQRRVQKDLEKIRIGIPNVVNNKSASSRSLNPTSARSYREEKNSPKRSPRNRSKSAEIDTDMLFEYLQKLQQADVIDLDKIGTNKSHGDTEIVSFEVNSDQEKSQSRTNQAEQLDKLNNCQINLRIEQENIQSKDIKLDLSKQHGYLKKSSALEMSGKGSEVIMEGSPMDKNETKEVQSGASKKNDRLSKASSQDEYAGTKQVYNYTTFNNTENVDSDKQWEQARQARYVRTREKLERDRELSVKEIFDQTKP